MGFDPGTPGSCPRPKAGAKPLSHPGIPILKQLKAILVLHGPQLGIIRLKGTTKFFFFFRERGREGQRESQSSFTLNMEPKPGSVSSILRS